MTTALAAASIALAGFAGCGGDDETTSVPAPDPEGATGASGEAKQDAEKPASAANQEGSGSGLEQDIGGSDSEGTDTESGQQGTIGDTTSE
ncbi:MAG TPA: hypothetical protein VFY99_01300 [Solirubrobacterales bacterium]